MNDLSFLKFSQKYLHITIGILEQMIKSGNPDSYIHQKGTPNYFKEVTKWSDFNILIPTLFIFYHGIELLLKGLLFIKNNNDTSIIKDSHKLKWLFKKVEFKYKNKKKLITTIKKYIINTDATPNLIREFIISNKNIANIDDMHLVLRYPVDKLMQKEYEYSSLYFKNEKIIPFAQELINDAQELILESTKIYKEK